MALNKISVLFAITLFGLNIVQVLKIDTLLQDLVPTSTGRTLHTIEGLRIEKTQFKS